MQSVENFRGKYSQSTMTVIREAISLAIDRIPVNGGLREKIIEEAADMLNKGIQPDKKTRKAVDFIANCLLQYQCDRGSFCRSCSSNSLSDSERKIILKESVRLSIICHLWSKFSTIKFVENLLLGGGESVQFFQEAVIRSCLEIGLCYETHQKLFDQILERGKSCKELVFPRARYPSKYVSRTKTDICLLLGRGRQGHQYAKPISEYAVLILNYLNMKIPGIYPFYSKMRKGHQEYLCALIMKEEDSYLYLKNTNRYFEIEKEWL